MPNRPLRWTFAALSTLGILIATLHSAGTALPPGWSFTLSSGDAALAELIQNLLLFIPLGASLVLAGVAPLRAIAIGAGLSFSVEFLQQWIPGRDPSTGDIICNTTSTAIGAALVVFAPLWLWPPPRRAAWQALGTAILAVLVWLGTGAALRPIFPEPPYHTVVTPDWNLWGNYRGKVLAVDATDPRLPVQAKVVAASRPPGRVSPLVAILDSLDAKVLLLGVDGTDLVVIQHRRATPLTLERLDLRWRGALAAIAPKDTFTTQTWAGDRGRCMNVNSARRCGFGYTIGDGWKLIYYPEHFAAWLLAVINVLWVVGWTVGVGYWAAQGGGGRRMAAEAVAAIAIVLIALIVVPMLTGLKPTPVLEWLGALGGLAFPFAALRRP